MRRTYILSGVTVLTVLAVGTVVPALAQDADDLTRGVARISLINGDVSVRRGDSGEWVAGVINAPLLSDDRISTAPNSRAEVQFDSANLLRMGGNGDLRLTQVEYGRYQMELARGIVTYRVLRASDANVEVDTPSVSVRPSREGIYRISVNDAGETEVTARAGQVEVFTPRGSQWVSGGQTMIARGSSSDPEFQIVNASPADDWDHWNDARDRALMQSRSYQYVGQGVYGVEDLDQYGSWDYVEPYGYAWHPTAVASGWAPYADGRWVWLDWYGWTWVSYDPWGWAPYHYGRWFHEPRFGWCWYPGLPRVRHYWSPALVAWFGFGSGGGFGFGFGYDHIGWVPLAPYEVFHPWWGRGRGYYGRDSFARNINITNINVTNIYRNARVERGITGISTNDFRGGRFGGFMHPSGSQVREAGLVRGGAAFGPTDANLRFSQRQAGFVPRTNNNTRFFTRQQPNAAPRIPFSQQRAAYEQRGQAGGFNRDAVRQGDPSRGLAGIRQGQPQDLARGGLQRSGVNESPARRNDRPQSGWQRFGEPGANQRAMPHNNITPEVSRPQDSRGWSRFGNPGSVNNGAPRQAAPQSGYPGNSDNGRGQLTPMDRGRSESRGDSAPRSYGGGGSGYTAPRSYRGGGSDATPRSYSSPRSFGGDGGSAPRSYSAPRSFGGGGGSYSAPRSYGGDGGSAPRSYSAPRSFGGGGGSYSAPRSNGGGGGSFSAPRSSAPRSSGGGAPRSSGGGGARGGRR